MAKPRVSAGGGLASVSYIFRKGYEAGSLRGLYRRLRSRNACKACALGMGGQRGGMVNEAGHFPEVCKKSIQAQAGDMAGTISEDYLRTTPIEWMERLTSGELERLGRIAYPLVAREFDTHFHRIGWEEALDLTAKALLESKPEEVFFYSSGRSSNEAAFLFQLVARAYGTANIHNCSYYCHQASGVALSRIYGSGTSSIVLADLAKADLAIVAGANPASNHPRLIRQLVNLRRRGGQVIVVNPLKELGLVRFRIPSDWRSLLFSSRVSDLYLQPRVGADIALFKALLKGVIERGGVDERYVREHTVGWNEVDADIARSDWETLVESCGVSKAHIDQAVEMLLRAKSGVFLWAMGLTHHAHGVDNILALGNLALARGWLGKPGAGLLPVRGHSNVQGVGSVGVSPTIRGALAARLAELHDIRIPENPGQDTYSSMVAAEQGRIRAAILLGGNLFASNPDREWAARALQNIPLTAYISTKLNEGHIRGRGGTTLILPALARDEESQPTTQESMFNFIRLSEGGLPSVEGDMRSEVEILAALAERVLPQGRFDWKAFTSHKRLRAEIAGCVPGYNPLSELDQTKTEFQLEGRTFHEPVFGTPDGKAHFHVTPLPEFSVEANEFRLTTLRSEGQFNSVVYEEYDLYRGNDRRDVVMISESDARRLSIGEGELLRVETEVGALEVHAAIVDITPGSIAMYYPEANALVPRRIDSRSKTPAFKSIRARIRKGGGKR